MRDWAARKEGPKTFPAKKSAAKDDVSAMVDAAAKKIADGKGDPKLMKLAKGVTAKNNPPAWVADEAIWEKAKKAVEPKWDDYDEPYAVVATVYKSMGGATK
jgi:hypothetical protein